MIQKLLEQIAKAAPLAMPKIVVGDPSVNQTATIVLYPGRLDLGQGPREKSSQPRSWTYRQAIVLQAGVKGYTLDKTPLGGSIQCKAIYHAGQPDEKQIGLMENEDYQIDYAATTIDLTERGVTAVAGSGSMTLTYTFIGAFTLLQEFEQLFLADVRASTFNDVEKWASLLVALILTNHDSFIEIYDVTEKTLYAAGGLVARHAIDRIQLLEGVPDFTGSAPVLQLKFQVSGRLELGKEQLPEFGLIEQVVSPERMSSKFPVDVGVKLDGEV